MTSETPERRPPPSDTIANFIRLQRGMMGWKQAALASKAGVSLSTVQRVERGEAVSRASLEMLAGALNQRPGAFTEPRLPLSDEEASALLAESISTFEGTMLVAVAPLRTEVQLRDIAKTWVAIITSDLGPLAEDDLATFREWIDLTSFVRAQDGVVLGPKLERSFKMRKLYKDVLGWTRDMERRHKAVCLVGVYAAQSNVPGEGEIDVAVVAVRSRENNPAARQIRRLLAPKIADMRQAWSSFMEEE